MNYYIDFDSTMFNTNKMREKMLQSIVNSIYIQNNKLDKDTLLKECKSMFNREKIYNIYKLAEYFAEKYKLELSPIIDNLNMIILDGKENVFEDVIPFLKRLKESNHKIYMLTCSTENSQFQAIKIAGSGLANYFDGLYIVSKSKAELDINYANGIFIDDNPKDLLQLYSKNPIEVIRIKRKENPHSVKEIDNCDIKEYTSFAEVPIK